MKLPTALAALACHRLVGEAAWVFAGQALSALGTLVSVRLVTEFVPPAVYGSVVLAVGVISLANGLTTQAILQAFLRLYPESTASGDEGGLRYAALRLLRLPVALVFLVLLLGLTAWAWRANGEPQLGVSAALLLLVEVARSVEITHLNAARRQKAMALLLITDAWLRPAFAVVAVGLIGPSAGAVISGYLVGALVPLLGWYLARGFRAYPATDIAPWRQRLWVYARPLVPLPLVGWVSGQADRFLVAALAGLPAAGVYAAIYGLASKPFLMIGAWAELAFRQIYYGSVSEGCRAEAQRCFRTWLLAVIVPATAMAGLVGLLHGKLASWLIAAEYREHSRLMIWIAAGYVLLTASQVVERICFALHDTRGVALVQIAGASFSIIVALPMIRVFGLQGAALAVPIYFGLQLLLAIARGRRAFAERDRDAARKQAMRLVASCHE